MKKQEQKLELTASSLKGLLWKTLKKLSSNGISPAKADAIASQSREIIRVFKTQQSILAQANIPLTDEITKFAKT